jgi:hypothetical protein
MSRCATSLNPPSRDDLPHQVSTSSSVMGAFSRAVRRPPVTASHLHLMKRLFLWERQACAVIPALVLLLLSTGCTTAPLVTVPVDYIPEDVKGWGLALSGGGIRSGTTSIGVIQALHEEGWLKKFDYVSSVSGGGYPVYGILTELLQKKGSLDVILGEEGDFIRYLDREGEMVPWYMAGFNIVRAPMSYFVDGLGLGIGLSQNGFIRGGGTTHYAALIHGSFATRSYHDNIYHPFMVSDLRQIDFRALGFPTPIIVSSSRKGRSPALFRTSYSAKALFEITPYWLGSDTTKYYEKYQWKPTLFGIDKNIGLTLLDAYTASGAAPDVNLRKWYHLPLALPRLINYGFGGALNLHDQHHFLSDGGFIDNTGILPLLRRGCTNILAMDASPDRSLEFKNITDLIKIASVDWKFTLPVPHTGTSAPSDQKASGYELPTHVWKMTASSKDGRTVNIWILKLGYSPDESKRSNFPEIVTEFLGPKPADRRPFPLESTFDQSYEFPEYQAHRHLGRYMALRWTEIVDKPPTATPMPVAEN